MLKYWRRISQSRRGERFNPLIWPFLLSTFVYGLGSVLTKGGGSSLVAAMYSLTPVAPIVWGAFALLTIVCGLTFLLFNIPPFGKVSGIVGFMLWTFGAWCYIFSGAWVPLFSVAVPNMYFWFWQYLSLSGFRHEDALDKASMNDYNRGDYDDEANPKDAKSDRENNRGVAEQ